MIWLYILIYFLGALFTGIYTYIGIIRKYLKEDSHVKFYHWFDVHDYDFNLMFISIFWFIFIPMTIIISPIGYLIKRINKHYNIE